VERSLRLTVEEVGFIGMSVMIVLILAGVATYKYLRVND
jgi:hypothetical protein